MRVKRNENLKIIEQKLCQIQNIDGRLPVEKLLEVLNVEKKIHGNISTETNLLFQHNSAQLVTFYIDFEEIILNNNEEETIITFLYITTKNGETKLTEFSINSKAIAYIEKPTKQLVKEEKYSLHEYKNRQGYGISVKIYMNNGSIFNLLLYTDATFYTNNEPATSIDKSNN